MFFIYLKKYIITINFILAKSYLFKIKSITSLELVDKS